MADRLRVALVGGPMYDSLYEPFIDDVEVVVHADHPTLNRRVAELLAAGERIDVLSTHGKYAPRQSQWLRPLERARRHRRRAGAARPSRCVVQRRRVVRAAQHRRAHPVVAHRSHGRRRRPRGTTGRRTPCSASPAGSRGCSGCSSRWWSAHGGELFDDDLQPTMTGAIAEARDRTICARSPRSAPSDLPDWHYDEVDAALLDGRVDCAAAWPGGYDAIRASARTRPARRRCIPAGCSYSGCHGWAIPTTCGDVDGAAAFVERAVLVRDARARAPASRRSVDALAAAHAGRRRRRRAARASRRRRSPRR